MDHTIAAYVAYVALAGVLITAVVAFINGILTNWTNTKNLLWQKEQWIKNKKQEVFFGCLKCLGESMPLPVDKHGRNIPVPQKIEYLIEAYLDNERFLGIMQSLQYVGSWLTMVEGYCSNNETALGVKQRREEFLRCLDLVLHDELWSVDAYDSRIMTLRRDYGLSRAHQDAYEYIMKLAAIELLIGRVPTLNPVHGS